MAKKKEMDQLTKDAIAARENGMSYGQWMAMHCTHKEAPTKAQNEDVPKCAVCGKVMVDARKGTKYCSDECYAYAMNEKAKERYRKKVAQCG